MSYKKGYEGKRFLEISSTKSSNRWWIRYDGEGCRKETKEVEDPLSKSCESEDQVSDGDTKELSVHKLGKESCILWDLGSCKGRGN